MLLEVRRQKDENWPFFYKDWEDWMCWAATRAIDKGLTQLRANNYNLSRDGLHWVGIQDVGQVTISFQGEVDALRKQLNV